MSNLEPEFRIRPDARHRAGSKWGWIIGGLAVLLLLVALVSTWGPTSENNPRNISEATLFLILTALIWFMHRQNIARLLNGTEGRIGG